MCLCVQLGEVTGGGGKGERRSGNKALSLADIEKHVKTCSTYIGAIFDDAFKNLLVKADRFSLLILCKFHWFTIHSTKDTFEIFDPLGFLRKRKCYGQGLINFIKTHSEGKVFYANPQLQRSSSLFCGYYAIFFIRMRELGLTFNEIYHKFSNNFRKNDSLVKKYVKNICSCDKSCSIC